MIANDKNEVIACPLWVSIHSLERDRTERNGQTDHSTLLEH